MHADNVRAIAQQSVQPNRLQARGLIQRDRPLSFSFDGRAMTGYAGDTLASALLANDVRLVGRSFKYHRPRGIFGAGAEEPNALVELGTGARREPNTKATLVELHEGLVATSQNRWPSLKLDLMSISSLFAPLFVGGFYYKTFMWPACFWERVYEPAIRRAAGLGRAANLPDPDFCEKVHAFCDVLIVGSGPAGLMAARVAARSGARVILCEEDFLAGGRLLADELEVGGEPAARWATRVAAELEAQPNVRLMLRTSVFGAYDGGTYGAIESIATSGAVRDTGQPRLRYWKIVAKKLIVATGATERMIAFGDNDRPGVMLGSAVRSYIGRFAVRPGKRAAVFTNNDSGWTTARQLVAAGIEVAAIVDSRPTATCDSRFPELRVLQGAQLSFVRGRRAVRSIHVDTSRGIERLDVDLLAVSGGWNPNAALATHQGSRLVWDEHIGALVCREPPRDTLVVGAANAQWSLKACLADGYRGAVAVARSLGLVPQEEALPDCVPEPSDGATLWRSCSRRGKSFVDLQNDVTTRDIEIAASEGYDRPEHLKRYTTLGMATDQGKSSGVVGQGLLADVRGESLAALGTTTHRPPWNPVAIGALANRHGHQLYRPTRLTPAYDWARERGAVFASTGLWQRAQYFPGTAAASVIDIVDHEVRETRRRVGITEISALGKFDLEGADAATFLDRVCANNISTLPVGKTRYVLMLREDGIVLDDGTLSRFAGDRFVLSSSTAHSDEIHRHLEFCHQALWPDLDVQITAVTDQWAQFAIAGPRSRELLAGVIDSPFDLSNERFAHLAASPVTVCGGIAARLFRISFSGELAYELAVPARFGDAMVRRLHEQGQPLGAVAYGTDALNVMRIEKGHIGGNEINGHTTAGDLGLGHLCSANKDYIGRVLAARPGLLASDRLRLVGLVAENPAARIRAGAHLCGYAERLAGRRTEGYVTSAAHSPTRNQWIALSLLARGPERLGEQVALLDPLHGCEIVARVCSPVFVDPEGKRARS